MLNKFSIILLVLGVIVFKGVNGQISGDWIYSYTSIQTKDSKTELLVNPRASSVISFDKDSATVFNFDAWDLHQSKIIYQYFNDSLIFNQGKDKEIYKSIQNSDTLCFYFITGGNSYYLFKKVKSTKKKPIDVDLNQKLISDSKFSIDSKECNEVWSADYKGFQEI